MEYAVRIYTVMMGNLIPLVSIADAMARRAATGFGNSPFHRPTFESLLPKHAALLLDAAKNGQLTVCNCDDHITAGKEISATKQDSPWWNGIAPLYVKAKDLIEWGRVNGDVFHLIDSPANEVLFDLKDEDGNVLQEDYYRGYVGWAESLHAIPTADKTHDKNLTVTALASIISHLLSDRNPEKWNKSGHDVSLRRSITTALNQHGWSLDGIPAVLGHIYKLIENGEISVRSTFNGLPPLKVLEVQANPSNWYLSDDDAEKVTSLLTPDKAGRVTPAIQASQPAEPTLLSTQQNNIQKMKKSALVEKYAIQWKTAANDIAEASRNGLKCARLDGGFYNEEMAIQWATERGKFSGNIGVNSSKPSIHSSPVSARKECK